MFGFCLIDNILKEVRIGSIAFSGFTPGEKVLDVCSGTGDQVFHYNEKGIIGYGIDLNHQLIEFAKEKKKKIGLSNVFFQEANATKLPFPDGFFDSASICLALHEKTRGVRDQVIKEMKRVVKKGGKLVFIDFQVPPPFNLFWLLIRIIEYFAGKDHYQCFMDYVKQGGLDEILKKNMIKEEKRRSFRQGTIVIILALNN